MDQQMTAAQRRKLRRTRARQQEMDAAQQTCEIEEPAALWMESK